jgi:hypothetical protein
MGGAEKVVEVITVHWKGAAGVPGPHTSAPPPVGTENFLRPVEHLDQRARDLTVGVDELLQFPVSGTVRFLNLFALHKDLLRDEIRAIRRDPPDESGSLSSASTAGTDFADLRLLPFRRVETKSRRKSEDYFLVRKSAEESKSSRKILCRDGVMVGIISTARRLYDDRRSPSASKFLFFP